MPRPSRPLPPRNQRNLPLRAPAASAPRGESRPSRPVAVSRAAPEPAATHSLAQDALRSLFETPPESRIAPARASTPAPELSPDDLEAPEPSPEAQPVPAHRAPGARRPGSRTPVLAVGALMAALLLLASWVRINASRAARAALPGPLPAPAERMPDRPPAALPSASPADYVTGDRAASSPQPHAASPAPPSAARTEALHQLTTAQGWAERARAARALASPLAPAERTALVAALAGDADWAVRATAADALAPASEQAEVGAALARAAAEDPERAVRDAARLALARTASGRLGHKPGAPGDAAPALSE